MSWTEYSDVEDRWIGGALPANEEQITTLIQDAEDTIVRVVPDVQERIDDNTLPIERVIKVVSRVVIRHLRNPTGLRSVSEGAGPFQKTVTHGGDEPGSLYLTEADIKELRADGQGSKRAFSINTGSEGYYTYEPDTWVPIR